MFREQLPGGNFPYKTWRAQISLEIIHKFWCDVLSNHFPSDYNRIIQFRIKQNKNEQKQKNRFLLSRDRSTKLIAMSRHEKQEICRMFLFNKLLKKHSKMKTKQQQNKLIGNWSYAFSSVIGAFLFSFFPHSVFPLLSRWSLLEKWIAIRGCLINECKCFSLLTYVYFSIELCANPQNGVFAFCRFFER